MEDILALRPRPASPQSNAVVAPSNPQPVQLEYVPPLVDTTPSPPADAEISTRVALRQAAERQFIIGEHVYRADYQHEKLLENENFKKLSFADMKAPSRQARPPGP